MKLLTIFIFLCLTTNYLSAMDNKQSEQFQSSPSIRLHTVENFILKLWQDGLIFYLTNCYSYLDALAIFKNLQIYAKYNKYLYETLTNECFITRLITTLSEKFDKDKTLISYELKNISFKKCNL